jgi:hypothetical protein
MKSAAHQQVWAFVQEMNRVWTGGKDAEALRRYFHPEMVAIVPDRASRLCGQSECVAGWKSFMDSAVIREWIEREPRVQVFLEDRCAVVTYYYDMKCEFQGTAVELHGRDMLTLVFERGQWWLMADQFSPMPAV